jgi:hypothetical protein
VTPFYLAGWKPALMSSLTTSRHESVGSLHNYFNSLALDLAAYKLRLDLQVALYGLPNVP